MNRPTPWVMKIAIATSCAIVIALNTRQLPQIYTPVVRAEIVANGSFPLVVRAPGTLQPKRSITIKAPFDAPVLHKYFQEGKGVSEGQVLVELDRSRILSEYQNKRIAVVNARADLEKARKEARLQRVLFKKQAVAQSSVDEADRNLIRAQQSLQTAESAFTVEQKRWSQNRLKAPFKGTIIKDGLEEDREVSVNKELLTLADVSEYWLKVRVDELEISQVQVDQTADVWVQAYEGKTIQAKVVRLGSQAEGNGLPEIPVYLQLDLPNDLPLVPKLSAETRIRVGEISQALSVSLNAIDNADGTPKVWVISSGNRLSKRLVTLGKTNPDRVQILRGLEAGERVALAPQAGWMESMKVKVQP